MQIVDANVLLYAVNPATAHHQRARDWLDPALEGEETVGFTWIVVLAFIRIATSPAIFDGPLDPSVACDVVRGWLGRPAAVVVEPTVRHVDILAGLIAEAGTAGNIVSDAHLAAIAVEHDATVVSFDADFTRFAGVRLVRPGWSPHPCPGSLTDAHHLHTRQAKGDRCDTREAIVTMRPGSTADLTKASAVAAGRGTDECPRDGHLTGAPRVGRPAWEKRR